MSHDSRRPAPWVPAALIGVVLWVAMAWSGMLPFVPPRPGQGQPVSELIFAARLYAASTSDAAGADSAWGNDPATIRYRGFGCYEVRGALCATWQGRPARRHFVAVVEDRREIHRVTDLPIRSFRFLD